MSKIAIKSHSRTSKLGKKFRVRKYIRNSLKHQKRRFRRFRFPLIAYRAISVGGFKDIRINDLGIYWTENLAYAKDWHFAPGASDKFVNFVLVAKINKNQVNWKETKKANLEDQELQLKQNAILTNIKVYTAKDVYEYDGANFPTTLDRFVATIPLGKI